MALKKCFSSIIGMFIIAGFLSCDKSPSDSDPEDQKLPGSVEISSPSSSTTYWDDESVACAIDKHTYADDAEWFINDEPVACVDGELENQLTAGEHEVTVRITDDGKTIEDDATFTVKEGFSVSLDKPKAGAEFPVGEEVPCEGTIEPGKYKEHLQVTVNGKNCTNGAVEIETAGQLTVRSFATIDGRTEAEEVTVVAKPVIAGKVYPLTDRGVASGAAGFRVTLRADGEVVEADTDADGSFTIKSDRISELGSEEVTLEVAESGDFYGSKAVLPADELLALVEADELGFILAPRRWNIRDGELAGNSAKLRLKDAFTRVIEDDPGTSFYRLVKVFGEYKYFSVFSKKIPLLVAFNDAKNDVDITVSDSTDFWKQTDAVTEPYVGRGDLFTSTTIDQVPTVFDGIHVYSGNAGDRSGAAGAPGEDGYIVGGHIDLAIDKFGGYIQTHEQIHNLSFGHASQWNGLMTYESFRRPNGERVEVPGRFKKAPSVDDVAHMQVYIDAFDLQFSQDISFGVLEWMQALDIEGLPETTSSQAKVAGKQFDSYHYKTIECQIH